MIIHKAEHRGNADHGWLKSAHTFSFADYYDPERMGFGKLRVLNDDSVEAGMGFATHPHRDMEIISIPLEGSLKHKDSEGNESVIKKGEVQIMSAGTGIRHSEMNASQKDRVKFLQIWVLPKKLSVPPRYEQKDFSDLKKQNGIITIVSPDGREGSILINQDSIFSLGEVDADEEITYRRKLPGTGLYLFVIRGNVAVNGTEMRERDGVGIDVFEAVTISGKTNAEVLLVEVPL